MNVTGVDRFMPNLLSNLSKYLTVYAGKYNVPDPITKAIEQEATRQALTELSNSDNPVNKQVWLRDDPRTLGVQALRDASILSNPRNDQSVFGALAGADYNTSDRALMKLADRYEQRNPITGVRYSDAALARYFLENQKNPISRFTDVLSPNDLDAYLDRVRSYKTK